MLGLGYDRKGNTIRFFPVRTLAQQILPHRNLSTMFLVSGTPPRYCANEIATTLTPHPSSVFRSISLVGGDSTSSVNDNDLINYRAALAALVTFALWVEGAGIWRSAHHNHHSVQGNWGIPNAFLIRPQTSVSSVFMKHLLTVLKTVKGLFTMQASYGTE